MLRDILGENNIQLTEDQEWALRTFFDFYRSTEDRSTFLLTGSAGTGKTFMIDLFSRLLRKMGFKVILLAPTGRAAKVISRRTKKLAYTVHHHIYSPRDSAPGQVFFERKENKEQTRTVYIVDEASMIGDQPDSSSHGLLGDLLRFVFYNDEGRKLIMVGDPVQLPPIGHSDSPALNPTELSLQAGLEVFHAHLTDVKRQLVDSGVLENAILIRDAYLEGNTENLQLQPGREVQVMENGFEGLEVYLGYHEEGNLDKTVFITYSNYQSTKVNQAIRHHLLQTEEKLVPGDVLMVVRNNYAWGDPKRFPFIANGEMCTVKTIYQESYEQRYGLNWVDVELEFQDVKGEYLLVDCKVLLDLLDHKQAQLDSGQLFQVIQERKREYMGLSNSKAQAAMRTDPYVHALQVKYGYAITGHKSQGGQWENVIIGFEPDYGQDLRAYIRWTYTVFTRAEERVFLLNCPFVSD